MVLRSCPPFKKNFRPFYGSLLQSDKWKARRLAILKSRNWKCNDCGQPATTVHHLTYIIGRQPWEYENNQLQALCKTCHDLKHTQ